jgi:hypothetical protein
MAMDVQESRAESYAPPRHDAGLRSSQGTWQFDEVDTAERAAFGLGFVMPVDAEQVARVHVPQAHALERLFHFGRDFGRVLHLGEGGDDDLLLAGALDGAGAAVFVDGKVNCGHLGNS